MLTIKHGHSLLPVGKLEMHFTEDGLRTMAWHEFHHMLMAMDEFKASLYPTGMNPQQWLEFWQELLDLHYARWGRRGDEFHARVLAMIPDLPGLNKM